MEWEFVFLDWLQSVRQPLLDKLMVLLSMLGDGGMIWILAGIVLMLVKKYRKQSTLVFLSLIYMFISCNVLLKNIVQRARPCWINEAVTLLVEMPDDYSFPSGHTMAGFAAATAMFYMNKRLGIAAYILASFIAISRLYLYVHFPTDILGAAILGILAGVLAHVTYQTILAKHF